MMIHAAVTLSQIVMELLNMRKFIEGEDLQELFREAKDHCRLTYLVDPWKNKQEKFCEPTTEDLITLAIDVLDIVNETDEELYI